MNTRYLFICLCLLGFLSSVSCSSLLVKFIPKYFIAFGDTANVCFLYLSNNILFTTYFCMLILFAVNSLNLLIRSNSFFWWSLQDFLYVKLYHPQIADFMSSFLIVMSFMSFSCLIAVTRSSRTIVNRSNGSGHSCLVLDLKGKAFNISPWNTMLTVGFWYIAFITLSYVPSLILFYHELILNFTKCFFFSIEMIMWFFFHYMHIMHHIYWFAHAEPFLYPSNKSHLMVVNYPFNVQLNSFASILYKIFTSILTMNIVL